MTKRKRSRKKRTERRRPPRRPARQRGGITLVTAEGTPLLFAEARYRHRHQDEIQAILDSARDFDCTDDEQETVEKHYNWMEGEAETGTPPPLGYRVLAHLTLTPRTLQVETMSWERMANCQRRLAELLGDRIRLVRTKTQTPAEVLTEPSPQPEPEEPFQLPPEVIAEIEDRLIRQWISEPVPALGGLTPTEAVKTPEGRKQVLELIDHAGQIQQPFRRAGGFAPDYRKAKKLLGLE